MAIGSLGITNMVKSGARLTIYLTVPLTILECFLRDQATMASLVGHVATDLAKIGISAIMSAVAGVVASSFVACAAAPIFATIAAGVFTGLTLQAIDDHFGLTNKLVESLDQYSQKYAQKKEELEKTLGRKLQEAERNLIWRAYGFDIKNPLGSVPGFK